MNTFLAIDLIGTIITAAWLTHYDFVAGISTYTKITRTALALVLWPVTLCILVLDLFGD